MEQGNLVFVNKKSTDDAHIGVFGELKEMNSNTSVIKFANATKEIANTEIEEVSRELIIDYLIDDIVTQYRIQEQSTLLAWFPERRKTVPALEEFIDVYRKHYESLETSKLEEMHKVFVVDKYYI